MNTTPRTFYVIGVQYRPSWEALIDSITEDDLKTCTLVGEPNNSFDRYAVKVLLAGRHIGYVPRPINVDFWALHDAGWKVDAKVVDFRPTTNPWEVFKIQVTFIEPPKSTQPCPTTPSPTTPTL